MKARFVYENLDFERGKDPKRAMGIGRPEQEIINKIQPFLDKYGFREELGRVPGYETEHSPDYHVIRIWTRRHRVLGVQTEFQHQKLVYDETQNKFFFHPHNGVEVNPSRDYDIDNWFNKKTWRRYFNQTMLNQTRRFNIYRNYESLEFERGKTPKEALDLGIKTLDVEAVKVGGVHIEDADWLDRFLTEDLPLFVNQVKTQPTKAPGVTFKENEEDEMEYMLYSLVMNDYQGVVFNGKYYPFEP